jgi:hypothetical protein
MTPNLWTPGTADSAMEVFQPFIVGAYTVHLVGLDAASGTSTSCDTHVLAVGHGLRIQLTWNGIGDIDLHLHDPTVDPWFDQPSNFDDCYYADKTPQWDASSTSTAGTSNPALDFDNTAGFGPGAIIHNYSGGQGRVALVQIFCGGVVTPNQIFTSRPFTGSSSTSGDCGGNGFWKVANVTFTSPTTCSIVSLNTYETASASCLAY